MKLNSDHEVENLDISMEFDHEKTTGFFDDTSYLYKSTKNFVRRKVSGQGQTHTKD
jgi:hypothetical protein